jgi:hypothetical protein
MKQLLRPDNAGAYLKRHWPKLALIVAYIVVFSVLVTVDHVKDERVELWDVHLASRYTITYIYDRFEGPVFWLSDQGKTLWRWPKYEPHVPTTPKPGFFNA